jgi:hypothetical protein
MSFFEFHISFSSGAMFAGASVWQYESMRSTWSKQRKDGVLEVMRGWIPGGGEEQAKKAGEWR